MKGPWFSKDERNKNLWRVEVKENWQGKNQGPKARESEKTNKLKNKNKNMLEKICPML